MTPVEFVAAIGAGAANANRMTGIPASVALAQAADESGWGNSALALRGRNLFGIKADESWTGPTMQLPTHEFIRGAYVPVMASWRVYATWAESIIDHARFFYDNPRYHAALQLLDDPLQFAQAIQDAGYSTDPQYAAKLGEIIREHNLTSFDVPRNQWSLFAWATPPTET